MGIGKNENFIASDVPAILKHTKNYILLNDNDIGIISKMILKDTIKAK